jgi:hypothetical protein
VSRPKGLGAYKDIQKVPDPIGYFENKPSNLKNVFTIYPLEAIGYEESVKSPYLDLLNHFKAVLRREDRVFIIGYSLRDPTIGSIFEEVIAERMRNGQISGQDTQTHWADCSKTYRRSGTSLQVVEVLY